MSIDNHKKSMLESPGKLNDKIMILTGELGGVEVSRRGISLNSGFGWAIGTMIGMYLPVGIYRNHLNPIITISAAIFRRYPWRRVPTMILAQVFGVLAGIFVTYSNFSLKYLDKTTSIGNKITTIGVATKAKGVAGLGKHFYANELLTAPQLGETAKTVLTKASSTAAKVWPRIPVSINVKIQAIKEGATSTTSTITSATATATNAAVKTGARVLANNKAKVFAGTRPFITQFGVMGDYYDKRIWFINIIGGAILMLGYFAITDKRQMLFRPVVPIAVGLLLLTILVALGGIGTKSINTFNPLIELFKAIALLLYPNNGAQLRNNASIAQVIISMVICPLFGGIIGGTIFECIRPPRTELELNKRLLQSSISKSTKVFTGTNSDDDGDNEQGDYIGEIDAAKRGEGIGEDKRGSGSKSSFKFSSRRIPSLRKNKNEDIEIAQIAE
ncbi:putative membrane protein [Zancudomyces culisetae]|uniref:Putative membrane protein n=1 Tax=Zancudomyces culisetae TaxID=1213189 RepID=A0A1R1PUM3_ZANCU|nr:putative membrane protein [Zancudomyces culisetae]|eukprot:OMH84609.1 putative membrane protein [Zancudomyces culisetae]